MHYYQPCFFINMSLKMYKITITFKTVGKQSEEGKKKPSWLHDVLEIEQDHNQHSYGHYFMFVSHTFKIMKHVFLQ